MLRRLSESVNRRLGRLAPERRFILRSERETRYFRLSPLVQVAGAAALAVLVLWSAAASFGFAAATLRAAAAEARLAAAERAGAAERTALEAERDAAEASLAAARAVSETATGRLEAGHAALGAALSDEREAAAMLAAQRSRLAALSAEHDATLAQCEASDRRLAAMERRLAAEEAEASQLAGALAVLNATVTDVAAARDDAAETSMNLVLKVDELSTEIAERAERQNRLFAKLEDAATLSLGSLEGVFERSGVKLEPILDAVRREHSGSGGPFIPADEIGALAPDEESAARYAALMERLERVNLLRIAAESLPFARPVVAARFTSGFGRRDDPRNGRAALHTGIDFAAARGTPIIAAAAGRVIHAGWRRGYGKVVEIEHAFGYETVYAHLSEIRVKVGDRVERGDRIGGMGSTGRSTGTHLHYEVRVGGQPVNPLRYIEAARHVL